MRIKTVIAFLLALFVAVSVVVVLRRQAVAGRTNEPAPVKLAKAEAPLEAPRLEEPASTSVDSSIEEEPRPVGTGELERVEPTATAMVSGDDPAAPSIPLPQPAAGAKRRILAYYFHGNVRCATCRTIEAYAREAVEQGFPGGVAQGSIVFQPVNIELDENRHFIDDFQLITRTVVIAEEVDGVVARWSRLDEVWQLVGKHDAFLEFVRGVVGDFLEQG